MNRGDMSSYDEENTSVLLLEHIVSEEYPAEKEHPMHAEKTKKVRQTSIRDAVGGIFGLTRDVVTPFVTQGGCYKIQKVDNRLESML